MKNNITRLWVLLMTIFSANAFSVTSIESGDTFLSDMMALRTMSLRVGNAYAVQAFNFSRADTDQETVKLESYMPVGDQPGQLLESFDFVLQRLQKEHSHEPLWGNVAFHWAELRRVALKQPTVGEVMSVVETAEELLYSSDRIIRQQLRRQATPMSRSLNAITFQAMMAERFGMFYAVQSLGFVEEWVVVETNESYQAYGQGLRKLSTLGFASDVFDALPSKLYTQWRHVGSNYWDTPDVRFDPVVVYQLVSGMRANSESLLGLFLRPSSLALVKPEIALVSTVPQR